MTVALHTLIEARTLRGQLAIARQAGDRREAERLVDLLDRAELALTLEEREQLHEAPVASSTERKRP